MGGLAGEDILVSLERVGVEDLQGHAEVDRSEKFSVRDERCLVRSFTE